MDYLHKFNSTFKEFLDDTKSVFPNDEEMVMYNTTIRAAMCIDNRMVLNIFRESVIEPFGDKILARDETFFIKRDYSDFTYSNVEYDAFIEKIKTYWGEMNAENRDIVWKYFKVLILLSKKISNAI
jgi:hypothetical protein